MLEREEHAMTIRKHFDSDWTWKAQLWVFGVGIALASAGCATVRPEQRAILAEDEQVRRRLRAVPARGSLVL